MLRRRVERLAAAHAEPQDEDAARTGGAAQMTDRARDIGLYGGGLQLRDVLLPIEVVAALTRPGGAAEEVEGDRVDAGGGEALRELLIERVKAADVRDDDDALVAAPGLREMGAEARAVLAREDHIRSTGAARDDR